MDNLAISLGVEEEFFLVDADSRDLLADPAPEIFEFCTCNAGPHSVVHEFLRSQIETNTRVCNSVGEVRQALCETRNLVLDAAAQHDAKLIAASTHPFGRWDEQMHTEGDRYRHFAVIFQESMRRSVNGGLHVHAGFGDADDRIRVMTAMRRYLPLLHALSTSSPFSEGRMTGFKSYRLNLMGVLPRTSVPGALYSQAEYDKLLDDYRAMDFVRDGSELWWDIRPSQKYPTVEMRICDMGTRVEETMTLVALYACLVRWLLRNKDSLPPEPPTEIIAENRWLAQRYGVFAVLGSPLGKDRQDIGDIAEWLTGALAEDAAALDCEAELNYVHEIIRHGSSADRQIDLYRLRRLEGDSEEESLIAVVDALIEETREGLAA